MRVILMSSCRISLSRIVLRSPWVPRALYLESLGLQGKDYASLGESM